MSEAVWKFELPIEDYPVIEMPAFATVLSCAEQQSKLFVWARVNPDSPKVKYAFRVAGTGHPLNVPPTSQFIGTALFYGGSFVLHVFLLPPNFVPPQGS